MAASLTESDNGKTIPLKVGAEATLRLPENPSTGYRWALDAADSSVATIAEQSFEAGGSAPGAAAPRNGRSGPPRRDRRRSS